MAFGKKKEEPVKKLNVGSSNMSIKGTFNYNSEMEVENRLRGNRYKFEFYKMSLEDPICGAILLALNKTFQSIQWKAFDDDEGILEESLKNVNFMGNMEDILSQFIFGHSLMEVTVKKDKNGRVTWNKMYFRPQTTLQEWNYSDDGELKSVTQQSYDSVSKSTVNNGPVDIPMKNCLLFNTTRSQVNPNGKSLFRNGYRSWYYKTNIEKIEAMGIERDLTGLPVLTAPEDVDLTDENGTLNALGNWAWTTVRNIKRNSQEGLVLPPNWTFQLVGSPGKRQFDLNDVTNRYSNQIALSMLSQFIVLGVTNESGSFALAKEQSSLFYTAVEGFALALADVVNSQFIGTPALAAFNGLKKQPRLVPVGIEKLDINDLGGFLGRLLKYNVITPDDELETFVRNKATLPPRDFSSSRIADVRKAEVEDNEASEDDADNTSEQDKKDTHDKELEASKPKKEKKPPVEDTEDE